MEEHVYKPFGDVDFFEGGVFLRRDFDKCFFAISCDPFSDEPGTFLFADGLYIDPDDNWIDLQKVHDWYGGELGSDEEEALAVLGYYGPAEFGDPGRKMSRLQIVRELESRLRHTPSLSPCRDSWLRWNRGSTVADGEYVSVWDGGAVEVHSECTVDLAEMRISSFGERWVEGADMEPEEADESVDVMTEEHAFVDDCDILYTVVPAEEADCAFDKYGRGLISR